MRDCFLYHLVVQTIMITRFEGFVEANVNWLQFVDTATLRVARAQGDIDKDIGLDASIAVIWRPMAIQNVVGRLSVATLVPGDGYRDLFEDDMAYAVLGNLVLTY